MPARFTPGALRRSRRRTLSRAPSVNLQGMRPVLGTGPLAKSIMTIYYNGSRIHRSLDKDSPFHRAIERLGVITSKPVLGGLHHQYCSLVQQPGARTYAQ